MEPLLETKNYGKFESRISSVLTLNAGVKIVILWSDNDKNLLKNLTISRLKQNQ